MESVTYKGVSLLRGGRIQDFLDMEHRYHARRKATADTHFSLTHLRIRTCCPCRILADRGVQLMFPLRGMGARRYCRQSPGCGLSRLAVPLRHQGLRPTVWVKTQEPVLFLLVG